MALLNGSVAAKLRTLKMAGLAGMLAAVALGSLQGCGDAPAPADYGKPDTSFANGGSFTLDLGAEFEQVTALAVQPDGKIVLSGTSNRGYYTDDRFTLLRYNPDGSPDETFGDGGRVISPVVAALEKDFAEAFAIALQPDGKILAAGGAQHPQMYHRTIAVARYNPDGSLDAGFGAGGATLTAIYPETGYGPEDVAMALALAPDGKIVVAGLTGHYILDAAVVRYNPDGSLDGSFGSGGKVVIDLGRYDQVSSVQVQPDGKILVGGSGQNPGRDFTVVRLNPDGELDGGFGQGGRVATDFAGGDDQVYGLALRPDGKIIASGSAQNYCVSNCARYVFAMAQYNADGSLDPGFGEQGKAFYDLGAGYYAGAYALARRPDGKLVLAGHLNEHAFAVGLYNADGTPDNSFDGDGLATVSFGPGKSHAYAVALQPDGKIVAAGEADLGTEHETNQDFALARFSGPPLPAR